MLKIITHKHLEMFLLFSLTVVFFILALVCTLCFGIHKHFNSHVNYIYLTHLHRRDYPDFPNKSRISILHGCVALERK